jgi:hypothetical protein
MPWCGQLGRVVALVTIAVFAFAGLAGVGPGFAAHVGPPTLLFERSRGDLYLTDLYVIRADGSRAQRLTHD